MKHLTSLFDLTSEEVREVLDLSAKLKAETMAGERVPHCARKVLLQIFEKPSLRTRVSFESGMCQLGGSGIFLSNLEAGLSGREPVEDVAQVIGGYADVVVLRTFSQSLIEQFAQVANAVVINGLSDDYHPCQGLTDILTIEDAFGSADGKKVVYVGDGNNVAKSLALACGHVGAEITIAAPDGYWIPDDFVTKIKERFPTLKFEQTSDPFTAVENADVIYTDVWASMGQEAEKEKRAREFDGFQVNSKLLDAAGDGVKFMHCLPARRGLEVSEEAMSDKRNIIFEQAENRMHLAKGVMLWLLQNS